MTTCTALPRAGLWPNWHNGADKDFIRLMAKFSGQLDRLPSLDFESILKFIWQSWGVGMGHIGLVVALRFKMLDSQPDSSNMGPVSIDCHDFRHFRKSCHGFLAR